MRFVVAFVVIAAAVFSATWYLNYDYNLFEFRLIEAIATYISNLYSSRESVVEKAPVRDTGQSKCWSWESVEALVSDTSHNLDGFVSTIGGEKSFANCLAVDLHYVNMTIREFDARAEQLGEAMPLLMDLGKNIFRTTRSIVERMIGVIIGTSNRLIRLIDQERWRSIASVVRMARASIERLEGAIPNLENAHLDCSCIAAERLHEISSEIASAADLCTVDAESAFRSSYNMTMSHLNGVLRQMSAIVAESREKPVSFIDNLFYIPIKVCIRHLRVRVPTFDSFDVPLQLTNLNLSLDHLNFEMDDNLYEDAVAFMECQLKWLQETRHKIDDLNAQIDECVIIARL